MSAPPSPVETSEITRYLSVLHPGPEPFPLAHDQPDYFVDLGLDQLIDSIVAGREEYDLVPLFHTRLHTSREVTYRQRALQDLSIDAVGPAVRAFAAAMQSTRKHVEWVRKLRYRLQKECAFLSAATDYIRAVDRLADQLTELPIGSVALRNLLEYLDHYRQSAQFQTLKSEASQAQINLHSITYRLQIYGDRVQVSRDRQEDDYAADVTETFERFRQGAVDSSRMRLTTYPEMNHVEEAIAYRLALLFPDEFAELARFCENHPDFIDETVARFDREIQFYLAFLDFAHRMDDAGRPLCYPHVDPTAGVALVDAYDAALADRLAARNEPIVGNDLLLRLGERVVVITGPNQGGKTTYARTIGQVHHLAALGLMVPGRRALLSLPDVIHTHFERGENLHDLTGKLDDDLVRIRAMLDELTPHSLLILNEIFTSTSAQDAVWLSNHVLARVDAIGCLCVCVTFLDELAARGPHTISMVADVAPEDPGQRTFRLTRRPADGRAFAATVAAKYGLSPADLTRRLES